MRELATMKTALSVAIAIGSLSTTCCSRHVKLAADSTAAEAVVVRTLDVRLPHDEDEQNEFLWNTFANNPDEEQFDLDVTEDWRDTFAVFAQTIVKKAGNQGLDAKSLRKALDVILQDSGGKLAYVPVGAYQTRLEAHPIWIVTVKWESASAKGAGLGHIRRFAFDQKSLKRVAYCTCM
jgi:hypothetical protein